MVPTSPAPSPHDAASTRREFLGRGLGLTIAVGVAPACLSGAHSAEAAGPLVKFSHGTGLCNMPLFYAGEKKLFAKYGADAEVVLTVPGTATIQLASGQVEMAVLPYTSAIAAYTRSPAFSVVSGSGIQGLQVVAKAGNVVTTMMNQMRNSIVLNQMIEITTHDSAGMPWLKCRIGKR